MDTWDRPCVSCSVDLPNGGSWINGKGPLCSACWINTMRLLNGGQARFEVSEIIALRAELATLQAELASAREDSAQAKNALMVSEQYRRKYAEGKYALYAMGGEFTEAAAKHLPWGSEGPLERYEMRVEREHSPLLVDHNKRLVEMLEAAKEDSARLAIASEFDLGQLPGHHQHWSNKVLVQRREGWMLPKQPYMWAVKWGSMNLAKDGEWEFEPLPSSRDADFYGRCRFDTLDEAISAARAAIDAARKGGHR